MNLIEILKHPEGKTLEFKRDPSPPDRTLKTIIAFANTAGGTLLLRVEDGTRRIGGVDDALDLEERVTASSVTGSRFDEQAMPEFDS